MEGNARVGRLLLACLLLAACGRSLALYDQGSAVQSVSQKTFSRVTDSKIPVVVEFYAPCEPARLPEESADRTSTINVADLFTRRVRTLQEPRPQVHPRC